MDIPRSRDKAGENEKRDLAAIITAIKTRSPAGLKLMAQFQARFGGCEIADARERKGNRGVHYDFEILVKMPGKNIRIWKNVEHKGCQSNTPIAADQTPWAAGVQFHNGGIDKYSIGKLYAEAWYKTHVGSGSLKEEWSIAAPIPPFEEWFHKDAKVQGDPTTPFSRELKEKVRAAQAGGSLGHKRAAAHEAFQTTEEDITLFKKEVLAVLNESLEQKHYWLTIHGDVTKEFHCAWYPKFTLSQINSVKIRKELDIWFDFECAETKFSCILRWGKGAGFSNLRIDARD